MEKNRFVFMKLLLPAITVVLMIQGAKSQTTLRVNVNQPNELTVDAGLDVSIDVGNNTIIGGSPTATGGTGNLTYSWLPSEFLDDETLANPTAQPPGNVTFNVTVTDERGCTTTDEILVIVIGGTLIGETEESTILKIYPNPTSGKFTINFEQVKSSEIKIALINLSGQVFYQDVIKSACSSVSTDVNIKGLSKGVYLLRIYGDFDSIYRQIILK